MPLEIERKFLISEIPTAVHSPMEIRQAYLQSNPTRSVRVRITEKCNCTPVAHLAIKGPTETGHFARQEFEYQIPVTEAQEIIRLCDHTPIHKTRYLYNHENRRWEVDVFHGANTGLCIAEIELEAETESITLPAFIHREVTGDPRYFNLSLAYNPYTQWDTLERSNI